MLRWLLPFILGIGAGLYCSNGNYIILVLICQSAITAGFAVLNLLYNRLKLYKHQWIGVALLTAALFFAGCLSAILNNERFWSSHFSKQQAQYLTVQVHNEPVRTGIYLRFNAEVKNCITNHKITPANGHLLITIVSDSTAHVVDYGDLIVIPANYKEVDPQYNPAEFNYRQYLSHQNIFHQSFLTSREFRRVQHNTGNPVINYALQLRQEMVTAFKQNLRSLEAAGVASTLLLGYKADLSPDILQAYSKTGTIHVLSVSGAHVAVVFSFVSLLLGGLRRYRYGRILQAALSITLIWAYALLTGFSPAVCRAAMMISFLLVGKLINRQTHALNLLAISAFALLLYNPFLLLDVGFQLSYLAVFGLIALQPVIYKLITVENKWLSKLWYLCSASIAAQIITFPLSAYYFHQFPVYFLVSNLFIIIPSEIIMFTGLLFLGLWKCLPLFKISRLMALVLSYAITYMNKGLALIEHLPFASVSPIWYTVTEYVLLYMFIALLCYFLVSKNYRQLQFALAALLVVCVSMSFKGFQSQKDSALIFLNLRKHSAIVCKSGNEAVVITDLKVDDNAFRYSIQPYLDSSRCNKVRVCSFNASISGSFIKKELNLLQFENHMVLIFNDALERIEHHNKVKTAYVFITGNPDANIDFIQKNYTFSQLIIDANNSRQRCEQMNQQAEKAHLKIFNLKSNNALIIASKK